MAMNLATQTVLGDETRGPAAATPAPPPPLEEIARHFPNFDLLECLGRGGMGVVYKARQKSLNRLVALKILAPERGQDPAFAERFSREAQALARLNHPNIVTVYDFGVTDGLFYLLMEFVDGVNLRQLLEASRLSSREALAIVPQICDALQYAHDHGIVHRDIKPENLLMDRQGRVKVADFGLAKLVGREDSAGGTELAAGVLASSLTEAGKVMGTPSYMAPEQQAHPAEVDHRADIYALGVVFYQMLTGELPGQRLEPPSKRVLIDVRLDEVVLRALEKEPDRRYQQASQVKSDVETIALGPEPSTPAQGGLASRMRRTLRRATEVIAARVTGRRRRFVLGATGVLLVAALALLLVQAQHRPARSSRTTAYEKAVASGPDLSVLAGPNRFRVRSVLRNDQDGKLHLEDGRGLPLNTMDLAGNPQLVRQSQWLDLVNLSFGVETSDPHPHRRYDIIEARVFDHRTRQMLGLGQDRWGVGWEMQQDGVLQIRAAGRPLPDSLDVWFRAASHERSDRRLYLPPQSGASTNLGDGHLTVREVRDGQWGYHQSNHQISWFEKPMQRQGATVVLEWSGAWSLGRQQVCVTDTARGGQRVFAPGAPHFVDFSRRGSPFQTIPQVIHFDVPLARIGSLELRPFGGRYTFFFSGVKLPTRTGRALAAPPAITVPVETEEVEGELPDLEPARLRFSLFRGRTETASSLLLENSQLDRTRYLAWLGPVQRTNECFTLLYRLEGLGPAPVEVTVLDRAGRQIDTPGLGRSGFQSSQAAWATAGLFCYSLPLDRVGSLRLQVGRGSDGRPSGAPPSAASFGPVQEGVLNDLDDRHGHEALHLRTGRRSSIPPVAQANRAAFDAWLTTNQVDLLVDFARNQWALLTLGLKLADLPDEQFDHATPEALAQALRSGTALVRRERAGQTFYLLPTNAAPPFTFAFQTRDQVQGLLQITGFADQPRDLRLRYKLVRPAGTLTSPAEAVARPLGNDDPQGPGAFELRPGPLAPPAVALQVGPAHGHQDEFRRQLLESTPVRTYGYTLQDLRFAADDQNALVVFAHPDPKSRPRWEFTLAADPFGRYRGTSIQPFYTPGTANTPPVAITITLPAPVPPASAPAGTGPAYGHQAEFRQQILESTPVRTHGYTLEDLRFSSDYQNALVVFVHTNSQTRPKWEFILKADPFGRYRGTTMQPFYTPGTANTPPVAITVTLPAPVPQNAVPSPLTSNAASPLPLSNSIEPPGATSP